MFMVDYNGKLIDLPMKGKVMIITDLHGNLSDLKRYESIWKDFLNENNHVIITGDLIHPMGLGSDYSIEVLELVMYYFKKYTNFHVLLGNHEWSHLSLRPVYKLGVDQRKDFELKVETRFGNRWIHKMAEYRKFFDMLPIAVRTENKVFISHAGPSKNITSIDDIINIVDGDYNNRIMDDMLWNRYSDFIEEDIDNFLNIVGCNAHIVGHTPVNGVKIIGRKQMILSSSHSADLEKTMVLGSEYGLSGENISIPCRKAYVILDLESNINDAYDVFKMVKYL